MLIDRFWQLFTHDIGIDLGTANTLVAIRGMGVVINEPSVVAVNKNSKKVLAVGNQAKQMLGRTPGGVTAIRPLRDGVISDFDAAEAMIRYFVHQAHGLTGSMFKLNKPRIVIGVPSLINEVETMAVMDAAISAGARKVYIVQEPAAAAIGAGLEIGEAKGQLIIDIGGGTTDIALISMGEMVMDNTIKIAGDELDEAIAQYAKHKYNLQVGQKTAEEIKLNIGAAAPLKNEKEMMVSGRDLVNSLPKTIKLTSVEVREALHPLLKQIAAAVQEILEQAPPDMLTDMAAAGATLTGGGALLPGIDRFMQECLKIPINIPSEPTHSVVNGVFQLLDDMPLLQQVQVRTTAFT